MKKIFAAVAWLWAKFIWLLRIFTIILRMIWYLFPSVFFLFAVYACFWSLSQGKDVLISALEKTGANWAVILSLIFWVMVTWYTGRILVYHRTDLYKSSQTISFHAPRMLGFLGFSIVWLALLQLPKLREQHFSYPLSSSLAFWLLLAGTPLLYVVLYRFFKNLRTKYLLENNDNTPAVNAQRERVYRKVFIVLRILLALVFIINVLITNATLLLVSIIVLQLMYLFAVVWRRGSLLSERMPGSYIDKPAWAKAEGIDWGKTSLVEKFKYSVYYYANISSREREFFLFFNGVSTVGVICYLAAIVNIRFANTVGTLPFILLAFAVLVGFFAVVSTVSVIKKINLHILLFGMVILIGIKREPHYVRRFVADSTARLQQRPDLKSYFFKWCAQRKDSIKSKNSYPVFFVLSDGGASRSGYWTAGALGRMEDETKGAFSDHLFCLSGTSGGGVGVGIFFTLLSDKTSMNGYSYETRAKEFLKNDFLTYTLTRMLGPDFFRPLLPVDLKTVSDRSGALEKAMESGVADSVFLKNKLSLPFSAFIPDIQQNITLPLICINTTRMQDGRPGVITNINLSANKDVFSKRVDVIDLLGKGCDMHLSTAFIMGARFPYLSPAGRIDQHLVKKDTSLADRDSIKAHYFVDGGYFDNSGAGVVNEMIVEMKRLVDSLGKNPTDSNYAYLKKLDFYIIHATNSPIGDAVVEKVNPLKNDLMAPVLTIVGAYGTQTDINNLRLKRYLQGIYSNSDHYRTVDLYSNISQDTLSFPMNWTISSYYQKRMNMQLDTSRQIIRFMSWLKTAVN